MPKTLPRVLVRSEQSDGRVSIIESELPAGAKGPPLHTHEFDEAFYVLEGELTIQLADELLLVRSSSPTRPNGTGPGTCSRGHERARCSPSKRPHPGPGGHSQGGRRFVAQRCSSASRRAKAASEAPVIRSRATRTRGCRSDAAMRWTKAT